MHHQVPTPQEWARTQPISPILLDTLHDLFDHYPMGAHFHLHRYLRKMFDDLVPGADTDTLCTEVHVLRAVTTHWGIYSIRRVLPSISIRAPAESWRPPPMNLNMLVSRWITPQGYAAESTKPRERRLRTPDWRESILARFVILASIGRLDGGEEERTRHSRVDQLLDEGMTFEQLPLEIVKRMDPRLYREVPGRPGWDTWAYIRHLEQHRPRLMPLPERIEMLREFLGTCNVALTFTPC